jgi:hypothetical protein
MEYQAEYGEIMVQRMLEWLSGWKRIKVAEEVPISGEGSSLCLAFWVMILQFLYTRSVHNSRIERIWYDVTEGFGSKWKDFFTDLEANEGLDINNSAHIWLLHHLFLDDINGDALSWAETWNNHKLQIRGEHQQTPQEMFFFSMLEDGPRGLSGPRQNREGDQDGLGEIGDISLYGVDWEDMDNEELMEHYYQHNSVQLNNPFSTAPATLSEVVCTPPNCPLPAESITQLNLYLTQPTNPNPRSMLIRRTIWREALQICNQIL